MRPTRRRALQALGATAASVVVAGCSTDDGTGEERAGGTPTETETPTDTTTATETETPTDTETETETPTDTDGTALVYDLTVRPELVDRNTPDSYRTYGGQDTQWVVAEVVAEGDGPPPDSFAVETPDAEYETTTDIGAIEGLLVGFGQAYGRADNGWVAANLPKPLDAETAALTWDGGRHEFGEDALERLNRPPATFDVSFEVSQVRSVEGAILWTVTVRNTADVAGTFVAGINYSQGPADIGPRIVFEVGPGRTETVSRLHRRDIFVKGGYESLTLRLWWRGGSALGEAELDSE